MVDTRAVQQTATDLNTQITAVRQTLAEMQRQGMPAAVTHSDANVRRLLATMTTLSTQLGSDLVPITGANDQEKFASLNRWLNSSWRGRPALTGRTETSPLDSAAMDELQLRLEIALGRPASDAGATALLGIPAPVQPQVAADQGTASRGGAVPTVITAETLRTENSQALNDLEFISIHGRTDAIRQRAARIRRELNTLIDARRPSTTQIAAKAREANTLISAEMAQAETRALNDAIAQASQGTGATHPRAPAAQALLTSVQGMQGQTAHDIAQRIPDVFLLGDGQSQRVLTLLTEARDALQANNDTLARNKLQEAGQIVTAEQALYARFLEEVIIPIRSGDVSAIHGSSLPQRSALGRGSNGAERRLGLPAGTLDDIPVYAERDVTRGSRRVRERYVHHRVRVGREQIEQFYQRRLDLANQLLTQRGRLSYRVVVGMYQDAQLEDRAIQSVISLWNSAQTSRFEQATISGFSPSSVWMEYARATSWLIDPELNPFIQMSADEQRQAIEVYLGVPRGSTIPAAREQQARGELSQLLRDNSQFRHDSAVYTLFNVVRRLTPPQASLQRMAEVRSMRLAVEMEYLPFLAGTPPRIRGMTDDQITQLTTPQLNEQRFRLARGWLEQAVTASTASGLRDNDPLIQAARGWLTQTATAPAADRMASTADILYNMALGLLSIREAELWEGNSSFRSSSLPAGTLEQARRDIALARRSYTWNFSNAAIEPGYHYNLPRNFADEAIAMMAPRPFALTEASGMYTTRTGYLNPDGEGVTVSGEPTLQQQLQGGANAEQRYLTIIVANRDSADFFSALPSETILTQRGFAGPFQGVDFRVSRSSSDSTMAVSGFPHLFYLGGRRRPSLNPVDQHRVPGPYDAQARPLANRDHEDMGHHTYGQLYVELYKQAMMLGDQTTPALLRGMDMSPNGLAVRTGTPFEAQDRTLQQRAQGIARDLGIPLDQPFINSMRDRMLTTSTSYAGTATTDIQSRENQQMLGVLDFRIAQLDTALSGYITGQDGRPKRVADLDSADPNFYYITRAREALTEARTIRTQLAQRGNPMLARDAVAMAEIGLESLTPDHAGRVRVRPGPDPNAVRLEVTAVPGTTRWRGDEQWQQFTARVDVLTGSTSSPTRAELTAYESQNHTTLNLTYNWIFFTDVSGNGDYMIVNPHHHDAGHESEGHYIGRLMRGIRTPDGRTVDAVVRVRPPGETAQATGSRTIEWEPVRDGQGRYDILYEVQSGSSTPIPRSLDARATRMVVMTTGRTASLHITGPTQAIVLAEHNR
ncbi:MAG TPA: hypothetical protein VLD37_06060 [Candidatus Bilamarchaeum sp.]|nr:hypothetical protein [Candidatus Bilamarchaeum sp.]